VPSELEPTRDEMRMSSEAADAMIRRHHPTLFRSSPMHTLDEIVAQLDQHHQRATYGAVAALLGHSPRSLMKGRPRNPESSWIVSSSSAMPTGYAESERHPALEERKEVLDTKERLQGWLDDPR
jgi:hypothetical protein